MRVLCKLMAAIIAIMVTLFVHVQTAFADDLRTVVDWERKDIPGAGLSPLGDNLFGESIDPHLGGVTFSVVDVSIPGNFDIPVEIRRTLNQGLKYFPTETAAFGDWELDIPRITYGYIETDPAETASDGRCSTEYKDLFDTHYYTESGFGTIEAVKLEPEDYGAGFALYMGGGMQQLVDVRDNGGDDGDFFPNTATHATTGDWYFTCTQATNDDSQGFIGHSPDGKTYHFDRVERKRAKSFIIDKFDSANRHSYTVSLLVTRIEDRFGNFVEYDYEDPSKPTIIFGDQPLQAIRSSDGREITLDYMIQPQIIPLAGGSFITIPLNTPVYNDNESLIISAKAHGRTWTYSYDELDHEFERWERERRPNIYNEEAYPELATLKTVRQPDGRSWTYDLDSMAASAGPSKYCADLVDDYELKVTHPYGAKLTLELAQLMHRMSDDKDYGTYNQCWSPLSTLGTPNSLEVDDVPYRLRMSVVKKTVDINDQISEYTYDYEQDTGSSDGSHRKQTNKTTITGPVSRVEYEHFWPRLEGDNPNGDGNLARMKTYEKTTNKLLETVENYWIRENDYHGFSFIDRDFGSRGPHAKKALLQRQVVTRHYDDGDDEFTTRYTYETDHDDRNYSFGLPLSVEVETNIPDSDTLTEYEYDNLESPWITSLRTRETVDSRETMSYEYDNLGRQTLSLIHI